MTVAIQAERAAWYHNRWSQLVLGVIAMMAISSPQYVWTLFTGPLNQKLGTTLAQLQWTFSLLIILQTWLSPFQAYLVDRFGPASVDRHRRVAVGRKLGALGVRG
jgi:MFS transporter, OFA family, oxalate/formate antiporter